MATRNVKLDEIGPWSEVKLDIVRDYASEYTKIVRKQPFLKRCLYIDAFAGAGTHIRKATGEMVKGSPLNALLVQPPFHEFHFIDIDGGKADMLRDAAAGRKEVFVYEQDCNDILLDKVFPRARWDDYSRALCLLDPYALNLKWEVIEAAGKSRSIEIFLNFMIMDMNMNVLRHDRSTVRPEDAQRMNTFWGDNSWEKVAYSADPTLFGPVDKKNSNEVLAAKFRERLQNVAGFKYVPEPLPMRNSTGSVVYYLYFASPNSTGHKIVDYIFNKHRERKDA
jgi:three-Cys-motif partner protein